MKDRKTVTLVNPSFELNKIGRAVAIGQCPSCKGKVYKILAATETPADLRAKSLAFAAKKKGGAKVSRASRSSRGTKRKSGGATRRRSRKSAGARR